MSGTGDVRARPTSLAIPGNTHVLRHILPLAATWVFGGAVVWMLRQPAAQNQEWLWFLLMIAMFCGAGVLHRLEHWLPGEPVSLDLAAFAPPRRRVWGMVCIGVALVLVGWLALRLWPDYHQWQGAPGFWLVALALVLTGASLVGAVGQGSPRAVSARLWPDTRRHRLLEAGGLLVIFAMAIFLRTFRLDRIPPGIYVDETNGALDALYILEGRPDSPFATGWYGTPNLYLYYMAAIFQWLGANWASLKIISLIPAILTMPAVYLLGRILFGPLTGLAATLLLAASRWHLSMSRWGWNETAPPLFQVLSFFFLMRGLRDRRALDYALSGLLMGLSLYTYLSARLAAATLLVYILYWFWSDPDGAPASIRRSGWGIAILAAAALAAVAPLGVTYLTDPFAFGNRVSEISIMRDVQEQQSWTPLLQNLGDMAKFFHQTGDLQGKHNLPGEPMTDPLTGWLFAVGVAYAIVAWRDPRRVLLLLWLGIGLAGSYLSSHHESPQSYRTLTALPAIVLMAADVLDRMTRALYRAVRDGQFAAAHPHLPTLSAGVFATLTLVGATLWESSIYFGRQAASVDVLRGFNPTENGVARETMAALESGKSVYLSPHFSEFSPLRFLVYGMVKAQNGKSPLNDRPYHVLIPEVNLPLSDDGHDVLVLLDTQYWPLRDYIRSFYPQAHFELVSLPDRTPIYMRVEVTRAQVAALQGLIAQMTFADGRREQRLVAQVEQRASDAPIDQAVWEGTLRLEHGGEYNVWGEGGLQVFVDGQPWIGRHYLGRGKYQLRVVRPRGANGEARLVWQTPNDAPAQVPAGLLFQVATLGQGLLGMYWPNENWEGAPLFHQITPFLLLAWPDEPPIVQSNKFSARFTGALRVIEPGPYSLRVEADDGARLALDGQRLGEGFKPNQPNHFEATVELAAGNHPIQIDYVQMGGGSALRLLWRRGDEPWSPVPPAALVPPPP